MLDTTRISLPSPQCAPPEIKGKASQGQLGGTAWGCTSFPIRRKAGLAWLCQGPRDLPERGQSCRLKRPGAESRLPIGYLTPTQPRQLTLTMIPGTTYPGTILRAGVVRTQR
jgi:hypothetical protein